MRVLFTLLTALALVGCESGGSLLQPELSRSLDPDCEDPGAVEAPVSECGGGGGGGTGGEQDDLAVVITGPISIGTAGTYTWNASVTDADGAVSYTWTRKNVSGYTTPYVVGYGPSVSFQVQAGSDFYLNVTAVDASSASATDGHYVHVFIPGSCTFGC